MIKEWVKRECDFLLQVLFSLVFRFPVEGVNKTQTEQQLQHKGSLKHVVQIECTGHINGAPFEHHGKTAIKICLVLK